MRKRRVPFAVSPEFQDALKRLQGRIKADGKKEPSLTDLTESIVKTPAFKEVEKQIMNNNLKLNLDFKLRFD